MKRFISFYGSLNYPSGGINDFLSDHDSKEKAVDALIKRIKADKSGYENWEYRWGHIFDQEKRKKVWST